MPLRARLTAAFLIVVLGPILLGAVFIGTAVDTSASNRAVDRLDSAAATIASTVAAECERLTGTAEAVALLVDDESAATTAAQRAVKTSDTAGIDISLDGSTHTAGEAADDSTTARQCGREPERGPAAALSATIDVRDADGGTRGSVTAWQPIDGQFVRELAAGTGGVDVIVDDGRAEPLSSFAVAAAADALSAAHRSTADESTVAGGSGHYIREVGANPQAPLPLVLAVESSPSGGLLTMLAGIVVMAALLAVGAATWLARSTTRPLAELADGADAVARGDLGARVPVRGNDELAAVARTFNRMARETEGYVDALTASRDQLRGQLALLGETLSSTLDLDRILDVIVDTAMAVTGARAGVMLLVDPEKPEELYARAAQGLHAGVTNPPDIRVRLGEGLLGAVAVAGESRRGRSHGQRIELAGSSHHNYLAVPVHAVGGPTGDEAEPTPAAGTLLGVLAIFDRIGGDFDDADMSTLRTFADQAAVAVGNVLSHRETQRLSLTDPLTGLWNYRYLQGCLEREMERAGRFGRRAAVIAIDLDRFKIVNDTYGHPAGDAVLTQLAERITAEIRDMDLAFRYGGEEFVVLLPETDMDGAGRVASRLNAAVRDTPMLIAPNGDAEAIDITVTVSAGVAVFPDHGTDGAEVLAAADEALYLAKAAGRNTWRRAGAYP